MKMIQVTGVFLIDLADWEKIYDLPAHSSTLTVKDVPLNVDVKRRLAQFENATPQFGGPHRQKTARDDDTQSKVGFSSWWKQTSDRF